MIRQLMLDCLTYDVHVRRNSIDHEIGHAIESILERRVIMSKPRPRFKVMSSQELLKYDDIEYQNMIANLCSTENHGKCNIPTGF